MINNSKHDNISEYIVTVIVTCIVVVSLCLCVELELLFRTEQRVNQEELNMENLVEFCTIEQLEKYLKNNPENYFAKIKLAGIYEILKEYKHADKLYQEALKTSMRSNFSLYSYAMFCARRGYYGLSATLAEQLLDLDSKANEYKARIYEQMALNFEYNKNYAAVVNAYQIAYKYAKNTNDGSFKRKIRDKFAQSYINLADENIENGRIEEAISNLNNSLKIKETNEARYKLGLVYVNIDKFIAEKNISKVFKEDVFMVNPYIYNSLLTDLSDASKTNRGLHSADFYLLKLNSFKKKLLESYIYKDDISIENAFIVEKKAFLSKNKSYYLIFDVENNTKQKIPELYMEVEMFVENKQYKVYKKMFSISRPLDFFDKVEHNKIELPKNFKLNNLKNKNEVIVKYFAKKKEKAPWTLIKIESLNI